MKRKLLFPAFLLFSSSVLFSQQVSLSNHYILNKFSLSPAYAGTGDGFETFGSYKREWVGVQGAPELKIISANGRICHNMGLGGSVMARKAGIFTELSASAAYAYHFRLSGEHTLSFGLGLGLMDNQINIAGAAGQQDDPVALNNANVSKLTADGSFGILYRMKGLHAGITLPRMLPSKVKNPEGTVVYSLALHQQFHAGYKYDINAEWTVDPLLKISMLKDIPLFYEVAVPVIYKNKIWAAPIYKKTSMAFGLGGIPYDNFIAHYSYEFSSKGVMGGSGGSHEITLGWKLASKKKSDIPAPDSKKPYYEWLNK